MAFKRSGFDSPWLHHFPLSDSPMTSETSENSHFGAPGVLEYSHNFPYYPHNDVG